MFLKKNVISTLVEETKLMDVIVEEQLEEQLEVQFQEPVQMREMITRIGRLNQKEKVHILNILKTNNKEFTKNSNGYFFNLTSIEPLVVEKMHRCLELIENNRDTINDMDKRREETLAYYKSLIAEKIQITLTEKLNTYKDLLRLQIYDTNISLVLKRIYKIHRLNPARPDDDPDELMKNHLKPQKYHKDSVYHILWAKIKSRKSNRGSGDARTTEVLEEKFGDEDLGDIDIADNEDLGEIDIEHDDIEDLGEIDVTELDGIDIDIDIDIDELDEVDDTELELSDEYDETLEDDFDELETSSQKKTSEYSVESQKITEREKTMIFYKKILNEQGYLFDENSKCLLIYQKYIK
jgi:hypothetical protein